MDILKIGVVVADVEEYKHLCELWASSEIKGEIKIGRDNNTYEIKTDKAEARLLCINCGIGKVNAAAAAAHLINLGCSVILNYGLSGGISGVCRGEIVVADRFLEHDFDLTTIGYAPCEKPRQKYIYDADTALLETVKAVCPEIKCGTAVCGDRFICSEKDRNFFKDEFEAMSCDMETAAIASVCDMFGIPFIALRRISDDAGSEAVDSYNDMNTAGETVLTDVFDKIVKAVINKYQEN
ncbi:MAG: 5'-methylthioadenosine/S-adenosylhomocysteine nucleosidase [Clostridia bacterium]|nr:5'-methylthioadenosine/S-adenosylhomocysteine nucleosidase [Clostridia bacterium]